MFKYKYIILIVIGLVLMLNSCRQDEDFIINDPQGPTNITDVVGRVIGENGESLSGVTLDIAAQRTISDENGFFSFENINLGESNVIHANRLDRFEVSKVLSNPKDRNEVTIQLLEKEFVANVNTQKGGTIVFDGAEVEFPPFAFALNGTQFGGGEVAIYAKRLNPEDISSISAIPGDLSAVNANNEDVQLASYSMLTLEMESIQGIKLELADDKEATITFPIDDNLLANAPSNIPLWHYDIETAKWMEEGQAELRNGAYVGKVSHFSWWNCDAPFPVVKMNVTIVDTNNKPIPSALVYLKVVGSGLTSYAYTDEDGFICGKVPQNESLQLIVTSDFECIDYNLTLDVGPLSEDTTLPDIESDVHVSSTSLLTANFQDCEQNELGSTYGYIFNDQSSWIAYADENGNFSYPIPKCLTGFSLIIYDFENDTKSITYEYPDGINEDTDIGTIMVCEENVTFINITIDGNTYSQEGVFAFGEVIQTMKFDTTSNLALSLFTALDTQDDIFAEGDQMPSTFRLSVINDGATINQLVCGTPSGEYGCEDFTINLIDVGLKGEYILGTFSGTLFDARDDYWPTQVTGDFRASYN